MGAHNYVYITENWWEYEGKKIFVVKLNPSEEPIWVQNKYFIRTGPATEELKGEQLVSYLQNKK